MALILKIRVIPNAKKQTWKIDENSNIRCYLTAPAREGKANQALIKELSKILKIPRSRIEIKRGTTSRNKELSVETTLNESKVLEIIKSNPKTS
ncbi:DUF167 domain-containing protein [Candidatus Dependentiae bacterium]